MTDAADLVWWRCRRCGHRMRQPAHSIEVMHLCTEPRPTRVMGLERED